MNTQELINQFVEEIYGFMGINPKTEIVKEPEEDIYQVKVLGNDLSFLIGYKGQSLEALQNILSLMVFKKTNQPVNILMDINGYKDQRVERIQNLAKSMIDKVRFFEKDMELPPMSPWERRQVHILIAEYDDIESESTGEGRERRVVLKAKRKKSN